MRINSFVFVLLISYKKCYAPTHCHTFCSQKFFVAFFTKISTWTKRANAYSLLIFKFCNYLMRYCLIYNRPNLHTYLYVITVPKSLEYFIFYMKSNRNHIWTPIGMWLLYKISWYPLFPINLSTYYVSELMKMYKTKICHIHKNQCGNN